MKEQILSHLPADFPWGNKLIYVDSIESTNTRAKVLATLGAENGTVLIADKQTGGRGRMGRSFQSPAGMGIYMSVILRPNCEAKDLMHLTCATAVAMCDAVESATGLRPGIKWTNDLVHKGRKLAGILTELVTTPMGLAAVVGIGINCCQTENDFAPELQSFAGSLAMATGNEIDRAKLAAAMMEAMKSLSDTLLGDKAPMLSQYRSDCITIGKDICLVRGEEVRYGHAFGMDDDCALLVGFPDGHTEAVNSGEVSIRGMYGYI